jgi:hypothetical protein
MIAISAWTGMEMILGLDAQDGVMLATVLLLTTITFGGARTDMLKGAAHGLRRVPGARPVLTRCSQGRLEDAGDRHGEDPRGPVAPRPVDAGGARRAATRRPARARHLRRSRHGGAAGVAGDQRHRRLRVGHGRRSETHEADDGRLLLSFPDRTRLERLLSALLDEEEFLSAHGIRSQSRRHEEQPFETTIAGKRLEVA